MVWRPKTVTWERASARQREDLRKAWSCGCLRYKLDPDQRTVYDQVKAFFAKPMSSAERWFALDIGRRWGKDRLMSSLALETMAVAPPRSRIAYGAPTGDACEEIVEPIILDLLEDCPPDLRPEFVRSKHRFEWPDGRRIVLIGCDLHPQRLRGTGSVAIFLTEPGFMANLDAPANGVLAAIEAQLMENEKAFRIYGSTPPETPAHAWTTKFITRAKEKGENYAHRTTYDSPRYTKEQVDGFVAEAGGPQSSKARREYFAEHVVEESLMLVPEWNQVKAECVREVQRPAYADCYVGLDPGWTAFSVALFGYWHFDLQAVVIEREFSAVRANTSDIATGIADCESYWAGWPRYLEGKGHTRQPYRRVSDVDQRLIADLWKDHGIHVIPVDKRNPLDTEMAQFRLHVQQKKFIVHPRCKVLIAHLDQGIWNKQRNKFADSGECGHFDAVAAAMYLDRTVDRARNPYPPLSFGLDLINKQIPVSYVAEKSNTAKAIESAFSRRRTLRKVNYGKEL